MYVHRSLQCVHYDVHIPENLGNVLKISEMLFAYKYNWGGVSISLN